MLLPARACSQLLVAPAGTSNRARLVADDAQEPSAERPVGSEPTQRDKRVGKRFLDRVLGILPVAENKERRRDRDVLVAADQLGVGVPIPLLGAPDQISLSPRVVGQRSATE